MFEKLFARVLASHRGGPSLIDPRNYTHCGTVGQRRDEVHLNDVSPNEESRCLSIGQCVSSDVAYQANVSRPNPGLHRGTYRDKPAQIRIGDDTI